MTGPVRILGAGLSGLTAAILLARAGREVHVFERRADSGLRFGGDLQGLENWSDAQDVCDELRARGVQLDFHCAPAHEGVLTNGRRWDRHHFPRPLFYLVKRGRAADTIDQGLKRQALAAGVQLHYNATRSPHDVDLDARGPRGAAFAVDTGIVFETDAPDQTIVLLHDAAGARAYSYLLVTQGYACCCSMAFEHFARIHAQFAAARAALVEARGITVRHPRRVGGIGHFAIAPRFREGATHVIGERAGLQDFLWGFGMRLVMRSGALAAECLLEGRDYAHEAVRRFVPVHRAGVVSRLLWEGARVGTYTGVLAAVRALRPVPVLHWLYQDGAVQRLLGPLAERWARKRYPAVSA